MTRRIGTEDEEGLEELMVVRTLRRLQGITYWAMNNPDEIRRFINSNVMQEWERDNEEDRVDSRRDDLVAQLANEGMASKDLDAAKVRLDPWKMAKDSFVKRLKERSDEMRRSISESGIVIWPLVLRGEDCGLRDGYCRFTTLNSMGVSKVFAYVGFLERS